MSTNTITGGREWTQDELDALAAAQALEDDRKRFKKILRLTGPKTTAAQWRAIRVLAAQKGDWAVDAYNVARARLVARAEDALREAMLKTPTAKVMPEMFHVSQPNNGRHDRKRQRGLLLHAKMPRGEWIKVNDLADLAGENRNTVADTLTFMQTEGKVERKSAGTGKACFWRRID